MQKIIPNIWFDNTAQDAVNFYKDAFGAVEVLTTSRYTDAGHEVHHMRAGTVMTMDFTIHGFRFVALNGGPIFKPNPSISFFYICETKDEVDSVWQKLSADGTALMPLDKYPFSAWYGWIQDRYGVSWQVMLAQGDVPKQRVIPSLMFVKENCGKAREAISLYTSLFEDAKLLNTFPYGPENPAENPEHLAYADFTLAGQLFAAMDSGQDHQFTFNEGISFIVNCKDQAEIDKYWNALSTVPAAEQCGWLKDQFGVSWQIVPTILDELVSSSDAAKAKQAMEAMLQMKKIDIATLERIRDS